MKEEAYKDSHKGLQKRIQWGKHNGRHHHIRRRHHRIPLLQAIGLSRVAVFLWHQASYLGFVSSLGHLQARRLKEKGKSKY